MFAFITQHNITYAIGNIQDIVCLQPKKTIYGGSMSQENSQEVSETVSEQPTTETNNNPTDVSSLIAESKKYRKRSQDAESRLEKLASAEEAKLKEKEDFKALYEKVASENESLSANAQKWNKYEENRRNTLLESVPETEKERLASLDLDTLEYITSKLNSQKPNAPEVAGSARRYKMDKPLSQMTASEKEANWQNILKSFKK
jgi:alanyl-tRNA synthetase